MLRYAIVGTNWLSHIYYHAIEAAGDRVAAVCSRSRERAAELGQGKALVYTELDEMLKNPDIDVVYLCIPNVLHADAALRCLRAGKHVLCEKPATVSAAEMEEILHTARTEGRIFAEAVMNFYSPVTDRLRAELAQDVRADRLIILTAVDAVCINFNKPDQKELSSMTIADCEKYIAEGQFAPGSMLPKVESCMEFVKNNDHGGTALITSLARAADALEGKTGTVITR